MNPILYHCLDTTLWKFTICYYIYLDWLEVMQKPYSKPHKNRFFHYLGGFHDGNGYSPWAFYLNYKHTGRLTYDGARWQLDDVPDIEVDLLGYIVDSIYEMRKRLVEKGYIF